MFKSIYTTIYGICGGILVVMYLFNESRGVVYFTSTPTRPIPKAAKSSRGYRSPGFWYTGYHGGK